MRTPCTMTPSGLASNLPCNMLELNGRGCRRGHPLLYIILYYIILYYIILYYFFSLFSLKKMLLPSGPPPTMNEYVYDPDPQLRVTDYVA